MARQLIRRVLSLQQGGLDYTRHCVNRAVVPQAERRLLSCLPEWVGPCMSYCLHRQSLHRYSHSTARGLAQRTDNRVRQSSPRSRVPAFEARDGRLQQGVDADDIITFIKNEADLERFLVHVAGLLETQPFAAVKTPRVEAGARLAELARCLLVDMKADTRNVYAFLRANPKILHSRPGALAESLRFLRELPLAGNRALLVLDGNPKVWNAGGQQLKKRAAWLRKLGLVQGSLQRALSAWPPVLTLRQGRLDSAVRMLRRCQFTSQQITAILSSTPQVLGSDPTDIEYRFQYIYFHMGIRDQESMVRANLFLYPLQHLRQRHALLERLGVYRMPNKQGSTGQDNPQLARIVDSSDARFATKVAGISLEEYQVFARTLEEEGKEEGGTEGEEEEERAEEDTEGEDEE